MQPKSCPNFKIDISHFILIVISILISMVGYSLFLKLPPLQLCKLLTQGLYRPNHNIFIAKHVAGINFYTYIYSALTCAMILSFLYHKIYPFKTVHNTKTPIKIHLLPLTLTLFVCVTILNTTNFLEHAANELRIYSNKSLHEKNRDIIGGPAYELAQYCKFYLPGYHSTQIITDMDMSVDPGMLRHRQLAYYLYPIDIRGIRGEAPDSVFIFLKDNAINYIPKGYRLLHALDSRNIIAVKHSE